MGKDKILLDNFTLIYLGPTMQEDFFRIQVLIIVRGEKKHLN